MRGSFFYHFALRCKLQIFIMQCSTPLILVNWVGSCNDYNLGGMQDGWMNACILTPSLSLSPDIRARSLYFSLISIYLPLFLRSFDCSVFVSRLVLEILEVSKCTINRNWYNALLFWRSLINNFVHQSTILS